MGKRKTRFSLVGGRHLGVSLGSALLLLASQAAAAGGQDDPPAARPAVGELRQGTASRATVRPSLDGNVLDDPAWAAADVITGFWQTTPQEGVPATERTEVRVLYTTDTLFIGVVNYDRNPEQIITTDARRDGSLEETDSFLIILDTYLDRQNGFVFGTNPAGVAYDGQVRNEGEGGGGAGGTGRQQGGSGGGFNLNWDAPWDVRTRISDVGWSAEFAIPTRTLRYPARDVHTWGINFQRNIRRRNETAFWAPLPRQYNLYRLSLAGQLSGLQIPPQRNLQVMPYVLGETKQRGTAARGSSTIGDVGVDMKFGITPSMTLDATYNTDFAQVEVDEQQVNLDRFSLFFPEKRPFFLENAGLFSIGSPREAEIFFSRRIGIGADGSSIPIIGGARLTGRLGPTTNVGLLNIQTEEVAGRGIPSNNFGVARIQRELPNRSNVGAMLVNRQGTGAFAGDEDYNRTFVVDGRWGIGTNGMVNGFVARTSTPGRSGDTHAYRVAGNYNSQSWRLGTSFAEVADNFNPEVGFLNRRGYRKAEGSAFYVVRPASFWRFLELQPHIAYRGWWNFAGFQETGWLHIDQYWMFRSGGQWGTAMNFTREGVTKAFEIFPGVVVPAGTYDHRETNLLAYSNEGAAVSGRMRATIGGFFGGTRVQIQPSAVIRVGDTFTADLNLTRNDIDLPGGSFVTNLIGSNVAYSFTPRVLVQALVQYNDRADLWSSNLRFSWLHSANTGLYIVYKDTEPLADSTLLRSDRSLTVKFSRLVNIFN